MINLKKMRGPIIGAIILILVAILVVSKSCNRSSLEIENQEVEQTANLLFGINSDLYNVEQNEINSGETLGKILGKYGIGAAKVDEIDRKTESLFSFKNIRAGHNYTTFTTQDTTAKLAYFVYESSVTDYLVIDLSTDSIIARMEQKEVITKRLQKSGVITSSLWNCMIDNDLSPALSMELAEIYAWSIDFFGLQKGDNFTVIYDQRYVDTTSVGIGTIWGASFEHGGKIYYAIPYLQNEKLSYWDENGNSLRKNMLKAPLKYSRISSRFSNGRLHPVLRIVRPHQGVDYAAPSGTPVVAVSDGVVIYKGYSGGGGNTIKIKHNSGSLTSSYMHLRGFAKGISNGTRVRQGDLIGYVGSTGLSTGPHLDFRLYRGSKAIDPLKVPSEPTAPIAAAHKMKFDVIKDLVVAELKGNIADSMRVTTIEAITP